MKGITGFIIGFSLSLTSVSLGMPLYLSAHTNTSEPQTRIHAKIDLFKRDDISLPIQNPASLFTDVKKVSSISTETYASIGALPQIAQNDAPEDDEILSINIDGVIPIEYENTTFTQQAEILQYEEGTELSAMLPTSFENHKDETFIDDNPWVITKGSKHIKNKQLLEDINSQKENIAIKEHLALDMESTSNDSYKVAERIKSSLLFPIPSEILNDENLTPTFIRKNKKEEKPAAKNLKVIQAAPKESKPEPSSNGLLNSISSWLSNDATKDKETNTQKNNSAPSYSSQGSNPSAPKSQQINNNEFVNFYKTLQETSASHHNNSIIPSELKLSFQPDRAEISGQTLRWLKAFSEAAQNDNTYLQIRLDASTSTELQRKRLNLLYTIFMNNSVDLKKIDTVFSLTEPNAFIIRTLKVKQEF